MANGDDLKVTIDVDPTTIEREANNTARSMDLLDAQIQALREFESATSLAAGEARRVIIPLADSLGITVADVPRLCSTLIDLRDSASANERGIIQMAAALSTTPFAAKLGPWLTLSLATLLAAIGRGSDEIQDLVVAFSALSETDH